MVDISKKKGGGSNDDKKKSSGSSSNSGGRSANNSSSHSGSSGGSVSTDPYSPPDSLEPDVDEMEVASASKRIASDGSELNYQVENGESEKEYIKRQINECKEFYDDFADSAIDNMSDVNEFTLIHHALLMALAKNRLGVRDVLRDRFGYDKQSAANRAEEIVKKAGEDEAMNKVLSKLTKKLEQ